MTNVKNYRQFANYFREPGDILTVIEGENIRDRVPLIGPSCGKLLYFIAKMISAKRVLELGTANGYSTIWLARAVGPEGFVQGTEFDPDNAKVAEKNLQRAGVENIASVRVGDAIQYISELEDEFDLIFLDIEKEDYSRVLEDCVRLLRPGGVLFVDNVAFETAGDFNDQLHSHPKLETVIINGQFLNHSPDEDAVSLSIKRC